MSDSAIDNQLAQIVGGRPPSTIADVLNLMKSIDNLLPSGDGLKWFNLLYMMVTQQVDSSPPPGGWKDTAWLARLDVVFAEFYFTAISRWLISSESGPSSWKALD